MNTMVTQDKYMRPCARNPSSLSLSPSLPPFLPHTQITHTHSHYKVVVVSTGNTGIDTRTEVPDSMLLPASQSQNNYYVAGAFMVGDLQTTFSVGNGQISILNGMAFENVRLRANQPYVFFTRVYSSEIVSYICVLEDGVSEAER